MKRASSILFLLVFAVQSLGIKTHFCYHTDGTRFHGDCTEQMGKTKHSGQSKASFHELKYVCFDIKLDKQYQQHYAFKSFNDQLFILTSVPELPLITFIQKRQAIPVFSCRGGPPILTLSLRGPPSLMKKLNHLMALAISYINSGEEPDAIALAKEVGVDPDIAKDLNQQSMDRIKNLRK